MTKVTEVKVNGQRLETVTSFRYLGSIITDEGSKPEILARIAQPTAALKRLKPLWNDRNVTVSSKIKLMRSLFIFFCTLVKHGPSQQIYRRGYKPWKRDAFGRSCAYHTKTILLTKPSATRSNKPSDQMTTFLQQSRSVN